MSSSGGVFSETLQSITRTKLNELAKKRNFFEAQQSSLFKAVQAEPDQKKRLRILLDGVKQSFAIKTATRKRGNRSDGADYIVSGGSTNPDLEVILKNVEKFLEQARYDPSISAKLLQDWERKLTQQMNVQARKYQYATLYGELVTEWLSSEQVSAPADDASQKSDDFEEINMRREERDAGRAEWERLVFEPLDTDQVAIAAYLQGLFGNNGKNDQAVKALKELKKSVESFETTLNSVNHFDDSVLRWCINGLLASGLLSEEKNGALKDFLASAVILAEVADVLNMRMGAIEQWSWEMEALPVEQRRHVTGKYHIYIDEDLLQAIFLQFIGVKWSVFFKQAFTDFFKYEGAWASLRTPVPKLDKKRREYFLGQQDKKNSIQSKRQSIFRSIYFLSQLPDFEYQTQGDVDGEEEADYDTRPPKRSKQTARHSNNMIVQAPQMMMQQAPAPMQMQMNSRYRQSAAPARLMSKVQGGLSADSDEYDLEDPSDKPSSPMETKQYLLHLLSTEILINTRLHGEFTCARAEFESWSPSLPHSTIYAVLSFFGMSKRWLGFIRKFLEAPLKFIEDGTGAKTKVRKRGAPGAHALSLICGEVILFCMDYAVNQHTDGAQLYRMHDDFWIWSSSHQTVVKAWEAIEDFSSIMGVTLNTRKQGTVRIMRDKGKSGIIDQSLPKGEIRWGFLCLDPITGRFVIDQSMVDTHIEELQLQLQDKKSVFSWIQAWNAYAGKFFTSNFGKPANCFGREHIDMMLASLERIQRRIFSDTNVVEYLKNTIQERFGISDIPDGYLYFPTELGGLELHNPFIGLLQLRDSVYENPESALDDYMEAELEEYRQCKVNFHDDEVIREENDDPNFVPEDPDQFMSFEEFTRYREEFKGDFEDDLKTVFVKLMNEPVAETVDGTQSDWTVFNNNPSMQNGYWRWVAQLYGSDMTERFGGLKIVDAGLLPMGMVNLFRSGRVKWQG